MPTPEELQAALDASEAKAAELQKNLDAASAGAGTMEEMGLKMKKMEEDNLALHQKNTQMETTQIRAAVLAEFPNAAGFSAHLTGTPEEIKAKAKEFHESVATANAAAIKGEEVRLKAQFGNFDLGSPPGELRRDELDSKYNEAKEKGSVLGMIKAKVLSIGRA